LFRLFFLFRIGVWVDVLLIVVFIRVAIIVTFRLFTTGYIASFGRISVSIGILFVEVSVLL
jgi:hypothetical protein